MFYVEFSILLGHQLKNRLISFMSIRLLSVCPISMTPTGQTSMKSYIDELHENLLGKLQIPGTALHMKT